MNDYRLELNRELLRILAEEREKEDEREKLLQYAETQAERNKMEERFTYERAESSQKIMEFNAYNLYFNLF